MAGLPSAAWLEPAAGGGAIIDAVNDWMRKRGWRAPCWMACDLDGAAVAALRARGFHACQGDYVRFGMAPEIRLAHFGVVISNPPYSEADRFVRRAISQADRTWMLLRLNWLAGAERSRWLRENPPTDIYVLPNRPDFTGGGGEATDYAWMCWGGARGSVRVLDETAADVRRIAT